MNKMLQQILITALFTLLLPLPAQSGEALQFGIAERILSALEYQLEGLVEATQKSLSSQMGR